MRRVQEIHTWLHQSPSHAQSLPSTHRDFTDCVQQATSFRTSGHSKLLGHETCHVGIVLNYILDEFQHLTCQTSPWHHLAGLLFLKKGTSYRPVSSAFDVSTVVIFVVSRNRKFAWDVCELNRNNNFSF